MTKQIKNFTTSMLMGIICAIVAYLPMRSMVQETEAFAAATPEATMVAYLGETNEGDLIELAYDNMVPLSALPEESLEKAPETSSAKIELPSGKVYEGAVTEEAGTIVLATAEATVIIDGENVAVYETESVEVYAQEDCLLALR